uniref:Signal peptidase complex catalytic subunit SEC11 n=2 Tax=Eutheria TaxID=9347 RepID=A0A7J8HKG1_MOLMO|nr:SEC11-like protein C, signal peptidase complex subunit [Molossus molossus]
MSALQTRPRGFRTNRQVLQETLASGTHLWGSLLPGYQVLEGAFTSEASQSSPFISFMLYYQVLNFAMIVSSALMIWKGLIVLTGSESPIVVVLSGSMEPAFHRGDLLFLTNFREDPIRAGEIVVFKVEGRDIPIVHRVIKVHEKDNGDIKFLTKGDNNEVDDRGLYKEGQNWLEKKDVVGRARGFLPYVGMVTIIMNDYPKFKYALLAVMGAYVLLKRES